MLKIFKTARIRYDELYADALTYIEEKYGQSRQVFSIASPFGQLLAVMLALGRLVFFYIEDAITELNIYKANRDESKRGLIRLTGHDPTRAHAASGDIKIAYNGKEIDMYGNTLIIPNNLRLINNTTGLPYTLSLQSNETRMTLVPRANFISKILQGEFEVQKVTGTGKKLQSFAIAVKPSKYMDQQLINVYVNNEIWRVYESLWDIPYEAKGCIIKTGITSGIDLFFGNGYNGKMPGAGEEITIEYLVTNGEDGNIRAEETYNFSFDEPGYDLLGNEIDLNEILLSGLETNVSYGSDPEPLNLSTLLAPKTSRNYVLANPTNYIYFFEKFNYFSIIDAFVKYDDNDLTNDNEIYIFLVPDINKRIKTNENYFTVPETEFVLKPDEKDKIYNLIEQSGQRLTSVVNQIIDPITRKYAINISLEIFEGYTKEYISQKIQDKLSDYFLNLRRRDKVPKSDLIAIVEGVEGVDSVNLWFVCERNEVSKKQNPNNPLIGLDDFGDIIIAKDELILIRGNWEDRNGVYYEDTLNPNKTGVLNIIFKDSLVTYNSAKHQENLNNLK